MGEIGVFELIYSIFLIYLVKNIRYLNALHLGIVA